MLTMSVARHRNFQRRPKGYKRMILGDGYDTITFKEIYLSVAYLGISSTNNMHINQKSLVFSKRFHQNSTTPSRWIYHIKVIVCYPFNFEIVLHQLSISIVLSCIYSNIFIWNLRMVVCILWIPYLSQGI